MHFCGGIARVDSRRSSTRASSRSCHSKPMVKIVQYRDGVEECRIVCCATTSEYHGTSESWWVFDETIECHMMMMMMILLLLLLYGQ
jgi:hypothetical protein